MRRARSDQPCLTFSDDWSYAFVERSFVTGTRADVLAWLDRRVRDLERPPVPRVRRWIPELAQVTGLETWDVVHGRRLTRLLPGSRVLWRVDISCALELEAPREPRGRRLMSALTHLHAQGLLGEEELVRATSLHEAVEAAEFERLVRQSRRRPDAPRAPLDPGVGQLLGRLVLMLMDALGVGPHDRSDDVSATLRGVQQRLEAETERQVRELRAALDAREVAPRPA